MEPGRTISPDENDIIAFAEWELIPTSNNRGGEEFSMLIAWIVVATVIGTSIILFIYRKRSHKE